MRNGTAPSGSLLAGSLATRIRAPETVMIGGAACSAGAILFARTLPRLRPRVRPIYVERGIGRPPAGGHAAGRDGAVGT